MFVEAGFGLSPVGGSCVEAGSPSCTHLVVEAHTVKKLPFEPWAELKVVKSEVRTHHLSSLRPWSLKYTDLCEFIRAPVK